MSTPNLQNVLVTGATGFVGRHIVRDLLARGLTPVCLVRDERRLRTQHREVSRDRLVAITGDIGNRNALRHAAGLCQAGIHLVGIIYDRPLIGQTFHRVHVVGTRNVIDALLTAGVNRYLHMSALGTRPDAVSAYHRTKWAAEQYVRASGLAWTIFRPSLIHGPDGEFMQLMRQFVAGLVPPVIPYFGSGEARIQPVHVKDVAHCFVDAIHRPQTAGQVIELAGPRSYSWKELYRVCQRLIPGAKKWKPIVGQPAPVAKAVAVLSRPPMGLAEALAGMIPGRLHQRIGMMRFNTGQVQMALEDNSCDQTAAERLFGITMRDFETELALYADQIR